MLRLKHALFIITLSTGPFQCVVPGYHHGGGTGRMYFTTGGIAMGIIWVVVLAIAAYFFYIWYAKNKGRVSESSLDILKKRYARGEITKEQFEEMKKDL